MADVEEADIYKVDKNRLFYLNTYRGFIIYDVADPKNPQRVSRLPVFGYPVEMFVEGNTVYALLRDALYLTQAGGKLEFERHNVSQLVAIDITDPANPKVLKTIDIVGQLREGVSRKIENTIYVVSLLARNYYWGWRHGPDRAEGSGLGLLFNVADPADAKLVGELKIFEGGASTSTTNGYGFNRNFHGVAISATAERADGGRELVRSSPERHSGSGGSSGVRGRPRLRQLQQRPRRWCRSSTSAIPAATSGCTPTSRPTGSLTDQFKQTYVYDQVRQEGHLLRHLRPAGVGVVGLQRRVRTCRTPSSPGTSATGAARSAGRLDFGKPNETVRGSAFDADRKVAYAITAQQIDPLYAISFADRANLKMLSAIDGLSGDMSVFRLVGDKKFLLAVGRDNSDTCTGFDAPAAGAPNIAVSIIDVQQPANIRLVQRQCVAIKNADWVGSERDREPRSGPQDAGHAPGRRPQRITVPVYYSKRTETPTTGGGTATRRQSA